MLLAASLAGAADVSIPVRSYFNKPASKTKFIAKGTFALPDPNTDNPLTAGNHLFCVACCVNDAACAAACKRRGHGFVRERHVE